MRLRFGRPSFAIMVLFAVLAGVIFYWFDNRSVPATSVSLTPPPASTDVVIGTPPSVPVASQAADPSPIAQFIAVANRRQQITPGSTIFIPRASIYSSIVQAYLDGQSWDISQLRTNVGHLEGTSWVDQPGNVVLSGHIELSDGRPGIFAHLPDLQVSDLIILATPEREHRYSVVEIYRTVPQDLNPIRPTLDDRLTLITCGSYDFFTDVYQERIIVVAERIQ